MSKHQRGDVAGGQGRGREIECYSETKKNCSWGMLSGAKPEKGHLTLEVKVASEIACDYIWGKLYPSPHFL
jgi:hypothetical protein